MNILDSLTEDSSGYSPLWDVQVAVWSAQSIGAGQRHVLMSGEDVLSESQNNMLTSPMGGQVKSLGLLVNCPVIGFVQ